jgi:anti-anti-sigma factor
VACFFVSVDGFPDCGVLALRGELDTSATAELSSALADVMSRERWVIVDLDGLSYIDCASMRVLACARERTRRAGGDVLLAGARGGVARLLELTGWAEVFPGVGPAAFSAGLAAVSARLAGVAGTGSAPAGKAVPAGRR